MALIITLITSAVVYALHGMLEIPPAIRFLLLIIVSCALVLLQAYLYGLNRSEREFCKVFIKKLKRKENVR